MMKTTKQKISQEEVYDQKDLQGRIIFDLSYAVYPEIFLKRRKGNPLHGVSEILHITSIDINCKIDW